MYHVVMDAWIQEMSRFLETKWGISPGAAERFAILFLYLHSYGLQPVITSGFRDPEKQRAMRAAWDRGDRRGLRARPADPSSSDHCRTSMWSSPASTAIDIKCRDEAMAAHIARALGITAGYHFSVPDPGHYAVR